MSRGERNDSNLIKVLARTEKLRGAYNKVSSKTKFLDMEKKTEVTTVGSATFYDFV